MKEMRTNLSFYGNMYINFVTLNSVVSRLFAPFRHQKIQRSSILGINVMKYTIAEYHKVFYFKLSLIWCLKLTAFHHLPLKTLLQCLLSASSTHKPRQLHIMNSPFKNALQFEEVIIRSCLRLCRRQTLNTNLQFLIK